MALLGRAGVAAVDAPRAVAVRQGDEQARLAADREIAEGLILAGDLAYFDDDLDRGARGPSGGDTGLVWVTRLELAF